MNNQKRVTEKNSRGLAYDDKFYTTFIIIIKNYGKTLDDFVDSDYEAVVRKLYAKSTQAAHFSKKIAGIKLFMLKFKQKIMDDISSK